MGYPNIPDINPEIDLDRVEVIDLLLASIGLEELSLAHLVNAEAEKLQRALGTLQIPGTDGEDEEDYFPNLIDDSLDNLLAINRNINKTLKFAMHKEFILLTKLEDVIDFAEEFTPPVEEECECELDVPTFTVPAVIDEIGGEGTLSFRMVVCEDCVVGADTLTVTFTPTDTAVPVTTATFVPGTVRLDCEEDTATVFARVLVSGGPVGNPVVGEYVVVFTVNADDETIQAIGFRGGALAFNETITVPEGTDITVTDCPLPDNGNDTNG